MTDQSEMPFVGLAPFLRLSIAGSDLRELAQALLAKTGEEPENACVWMNLATAFFSIGERELGLSMQAQALELQRSYTLPAARQPARFRLLMLMAAGDLAENTPLDCLLEDSDVDLLFYYATVDAPLPPSLPEHDAVLVAISETGDSRPILEALVPLLRHWDKPVVNAPQHIPNIERRTASALLQQVPGLVIPPTVPLARAALEAIARGEASLADAFEGGGFPIILRPLGSHAGRDLAKIDDAAGIADYLAKVADPDFYLAPFIDYSGPDGLFRKYRVALIAGRPFACHMAISSHWMIHYVNAGMYEDAAKRVEERAFMEHFDGFARRHAVALEAIYRRSQLDYVCVDCAETRDGELLIFEIDHAMVVHAMDPEALFPYKQVHMLKVKQAFEDFLYSLDAPSK